MKYKFNAFIASVLFLSSLTFALAASGACSGHGGVECSAGADSDGSVICVDGWRNSSVSYASMVKCQGYSTVQQEAPTPVVVRPEPVPITTPTPTPLPIEKKVVAKPVETKAKPVTAKASSTPQKIKVATSTATTTVVTEKKPVEPKALSTMPVIAKESGAKSLLKRLKFW